MIRIFLILLILPFVGNCQSEKKFAIGLSFSLDRCYRFLSSTDENGKSIITTRDYEIPKLGYTAGCNFNWFLGNRFSLEGGILFANKGYKTKMQEITWVTPQGSSVNDPALPVRFRHSYNYTYIDIPIKARYNFITKKLKFYGLGGFSTNVFIQEKISRHFEYANGNVSDTKSVSTTKYRPVNLAAIIGLGLSMDIGTNSFIKVEPVYRSSVISIIDAPVKGFLTQAGIDLGYYFRF